MKQRDQLSLLADVLIPVSYIAALAGITLWIILCVQDGYARPASTSPATTGGRAGPYLFDTSATAGKTVGLVIFGVASAANLVGLILRDRIMLYSLVGGGLLCVADTTADLRNVFTHMPPPRYPAEAWERRSTGSRRIEGITVCRVSLDGGGTVTAVQLIKSSGNKALDFAAKEAFWNWRARPGRSGRFFDIPVNFSANHSPQLPGNLGNLGHNPNR